MSNLDCDFLESILDGRIADREVGVWRGPIPPQSLDRLRRIGMPDLAQDLAEEDAVHQSRQSPSDLPCKGCGGSAVPGSDLCSRCERFEAIETDKLPRNPPKNKT